MEKFHRAFGVYGILTDNQGRLLAIKKNAGPYVNRYDLPGGSLEDGEPLDQAIIREIKEETGLAVKRLSQIGITSFRYPWDFKRYHYNQHIAVFYDVSLTADAVAESVPQFVGQDSMGALYLDLTAITMKNASPLLLKAKEYLLNNRHFEAADTTFKQWDVLKEADF